jgi:ABC-type polysaccharide/polyol phosphate transport system ATPase subunit
VEFSELRDFINTPLKNYSSGMIARLSFSISTEVNPDILLIDEMFAVGDEHFNQKSYERILEFNRKGVTIIFVSHKMEEIRNICSTVLWLDHGKIKMTGMPEDVINEYELYMRNITL